VLQCGSRFVVLVVLVLVLSTAVVTDCAPIVSCLRGAQIPQSLLCLLSVQERF